MGESARFADEVWRLGLAPDPQLSITEWADEYRLLPATAAEPGRWRTSRTPYLREIMDALSLGSGIDKVVVMAAAQVGKTEVGLNLMGSMIHITPGLGLFVMPTTDAARRTVRTRVDPMISATPELAERVVSPGPRKAGNSAFFKSYPGGALAFVGANAGAGLRSTPARFVVLDEVDAFPLDIVGEGDPVTLAIARTLTFGGRRKILLTSTPTLAGISRIEADYGETDQRRYFVPCPHCQASQVLTWEHVRWPDGRPENAYVACGECGGVIEERHKAAMVRAGQWRATAEGDSRSAGFHIPGLISPFVSWGELAVDRVAAERSVSRVQVWTNTALGEPFEDRETAPLAPEVLMERADEADPSWSERLPDGVVLITCGADVQQDRIEAEFVGWGVGERSWSLDYAVVWGDTALDEVWAAFDRLILRRFPHCRAVDDLRVSAVAVDAGFRTDRVLDFTHRRASRRVWPVKGRAGQGVPPWPSRPPKLRRRGLPPVNIVGVDPLKRTIMDRLRLTEPGPGFCALPADREAEWFRQLVSERQVRKIHAGRPRLEWVTDPGVRNEALDARVYATAALHGLRAHGVDLAAAAARIGDAPLKGAGAKEAEPEKKPAPRVTRSRWMQTGR